VPFFQEYLIKLLTKSLEHYVPFHAGRIFKANLDYKKNYRYDEYRFQFERIKLIYHDNSSSWSEFQKLKSIVEK